MLMLMLMFSKNIVDTSWLIVLHFMPMPTCPLLTGHYSDINMSIRRMQSFDILMLMFAWLVTTGLKTEKRP